MKRSIYSRRLPFAIASTKQNVRFVNNRQRKLAVVHTFYDITKSANYNQDVWFFVVSSPPSFQISPLGTVSSRRTIRKMDGNFLTRLFRFPLPTVIKGIKPGKFVLDLGIRYPNPAIQDAVDGRFYPSFPLFMRGTLH